MNLDFNLCAAIQVLWVVGGIYWYLKRSDEVVALASGLVLYFSSYRFFTVLQGWRTWGDISNLGFGMVSNEEALLALNAIVLGQTLMLGTYVVVQNRSFGNSNFLLAPAFAAWLQPRVFWAALIVLPLSLLIRGQIRQLVSEGTSMAFGTSAYIRLFPMVLSSVAILLIILWRYGGMPAAKRWTALFLIASLFYFTFGVTGRFNFLSWIIAGGIILSAPYAPLKRLTILVLAATLALGIFALAGAMRSDTGLSDEQEAWDRLVRAEDANMLDGLVLLQQAVPARLPFRHGGEHLEILTRPIPRAWWPDKPISNYMLKIAGLDQARTFTVGISPTLFGSFYLEAGYLGIAVLSVAYGFGLARLMRYGTTLHAFGGLLIRGLVCACIIPLLRGGDLPGVYAWIAMAFWPLLLLLWFRRQQLRPGSPWFSGASAIPLPPQRRRRLRPLPAAKGAGRAVPQVAQRPPQPSSV